ncbi:MAG: flippase-like domain-containing protein [archaeon]|nr:flippase-like domain-containing protein [archaeon]
MVSAKKIAVIIGIAIFLYILSQVDIPSVQGILFSANIYLLLFSIAILAVLVFLKGLKWKLILESQGKQISALKGTKYFCIGFFYSTFTPGRVGDFVRALYIRKIASLPLAFSSIVLDRIIDISLLVLFAAAGSIYFLETTGIAVIPIELILAIIAALAFAVFLLFREQFIRPLLRPFFNMLVPEKAKKKLSGGFAEFFASTKLVLSNKIPFAIAILVSALFWVGEIVFAYFLAKSIGLEIPMLFMVFLYPVVVLGDLIPVSVSGFGTREAILITFFSVLGQSPESAVAFSLLIFATSYVLVALAGFLFSLSEPVELKMLETE